MFLFKVINDERTSPETTTATTSPSTISSSEPNTKTTTNVLTPPTIANLTNILFITPSVFTEQIPYNDLENITNIVILKSFEHPIN